jgi:hypothetical protein
MKLLNYFKKDPKADFLALLGKESIKSAMSIRELSGKSGNLSEEEFAEWFELVLSFLCFYLHLTDRMAHQELSAEKREEIMQYLEDVSFETIITSHFKYPTLEALINVKRKVGETFNERQIEFGKYKKLVANVKEGESPKNTLLWEFGKSVAELTGNLNDPGYILPAMEIAMQSLTKLNIKSFLKSI